MLYKDIGKPDKLTISENEVRWERIEEDISGLLKKWGNISDRTNFTPHEIRIYIKEINEIIVYYQSLEVIIK